MPYLYVRNPPLSKYFAEETSHLEKSIIKF